MVPVKEVGTGPTVLVVDDSNLCRELVVEALRGHGYLTLSASDGESGMISLEENRVDAVILDNEMPNMDGLTFLKKVREDSRWEQLPIVMLTTNVSRESISEAMSHKICGYLLKSRFSMPEMLARVRTAVARNRAASAPEPSAPPERKAAPERPKPVKPPAPAPKKEVPAPVPLNVPNLVTRDATLAAITEFTFKKTLSGILAQVAKIAGGERPSVAEMAAAIRQDPVMAARVIHLAATSGQKTRLATMDDAVRTAGMDAVRDLAATLEVYKEFPEAGAEGVGILRFWQHSLATAVVMSHVVPKADTVPTGLPHLIGLFHDLPELFLRQRFPAEFAAMIDFGNQSHVSVSGLVASVFGLSYAEITDALFGKLKFPAVIADPIKAFSFHVGESVDAHKSLLPRSLAISDLVAHGMLFAPSGDSIVTPVSQNDCRTMLIPTTPIAFAEIRADVVAAISKAANVAAAEEAAATKPLLARREVSIWYVRHQSFASLDPVEVAFNSLANIKVYDRVPQVNEMEGLQGLVILSPAPSPPLLSEAIRMRAQSGEEISILNIVGAAAETPTDPPDGVVEIEHLVPLNRLVEFISGLKVAA